MIKNISHNGKHFLQTCLNIFIQLHLTEELNFVSEVDKMAFRSEFENMPRKMITLPTIIAKVRTSNKVTISPNCKMKFISKS